MKQEIECCSYRDSDDRPKNTSRTITQIILCPYNSFIFSSSTIHIYIHTHQIWIHFNVLFSKFYSPTILKHKFGYYCFQKLFLKFLKNWLFYYFTKYKTCPCFKNTTTLSIREENSKTLTMVFNHNSKIIIKKDFIHLQIYGHNGTNDDACFSHPFYFFY